MIYYLLYLYHVASTMYLKSHSDGYAKAVEDCKSVMENIYATSNI